MMPTWTLATGIAGLLLLVGLTLLVAEAVLGCVRPELDYFCVLQPCQRKTLRLIDAVVQGVQLVARFETNTCGMRGRSFSPRDSYRILAMGCSVTLSAFVDQEKTWTYLLERSLSAGNRRSVWVGSVGRDEATTRDLITLMQFLVPQYCQSLDFLVMMPGVNDMALLLSKAEDYVPFYLDDVGLDHRLRRVFCRLPRRRSSEPPYRRTLLWRAAGCVWRRVWKQTYSGEGSFYVAKRQARQHADEIINRLPDLSQGLEEYAHNLNTIIDLGRSLGMGLLFMTQPHSWGAGCGGAEPTQLWFGWVAGTAHYYSVGVLGEAMAVYNQTTVAVCRERGADFIDLASILAPKPPVLYDDVHFNENGCRAVAEQLQTYFRSRLE